MGGLARRATAFKTIRDQKDPKDYILFLAGPYELNSLNSQAISSKNYFLLSQIFSKLNYDLGLYSPHEVTKTAIEKNNPPKGWIKVKKNLQNQIFSFHGHRMACLIFPEIKRSIDKSWDKVKKQIQDRAKVLRKNATLIIGISPWGFNLEQRFLTSCAGAVDILLGSNVGPTIRGKLTKDSQTLWIRPYSKGKAINLVRLPDWTKLGQKDEWVLNKNIDPGLIVLNDRFKPDSKITSIIYKARNGISQD